jgi:outer membrane lipoprotein carrier protein
VSKAHVTNAVSVCLILLFCTHAYAGDTAQEVLDKVAAKYASVTDAEIHFTQTTKFSVAGLQQQASGILYFKKPQKYHLEVETQTIVTDGETVWSYSAVNKQVIIDKFKVDEQAMTPDRVLVHAPSDFTSSILGQEKIGKTETVVLKLVPRSDNSSITAMKIWVSENDWMFRKVEIADISGKESTYLVTSLKMNIDLPDDRFSFQIPEGVEVVDLR